MIVQGEKDRGENLVHSLDVADVGVYLRVDEEDAAHVIVDVVDSLREFAFDELLRVNLNVNFFHFLSSSFCKVR